MVFSPLVGTGLMPLISASIVSPEVQASGGFWLQSIFDGLAETELLTGATATVVVAVPAAKRATDALSCSVPRGHGLVFSFPFEMLTMTRWLAPTMTEPDHSSFPYLVTVNS